MVYFECYYTAGKHDRLSLIYFHSHTTLPLDTLSSQFGDLQTSRFLSDGVARMSAEQTKDSLNYEPIKTDF